VNHVYGIGHWTSTSYEVPMNNTNHTLGATLYAWYYYGVNTTNQFRYIDEQPWPSNAPCSNKKSFEEEEFVL